MVERMGRMTDPEEIARSLRPATVAKLSEWGDDRSIYCSPIPPKSPLRRLSLVENYGGGAYYITDLGLAVRDILKRKDQS